jgi:GTP cyclohydrolase II
MDNKLYMEKKVCTRLPTEFGEFTLYLYSCNLDNKEHLAIIKGDISGKENVLSRVIPNVLRVKFCVHNAATAENNYRMP